MKKKIDHYVYLTSREARRYTAKAISQGILCDPNKLKCELQKNCPVGVFSDGKTVRLDDANCWHHKSYKMGVSALGKFLWRETLQSRENMLALCSSCHKWLHTQAEKDPDKYSDLCPTFGEFIKARNLIFFDAENPPRDDLLSLKEVERIFGVSATLCENKLVQNGFNTYKMRSVSGGESANCRNFYSKSDLLKAGFLVSVAKAGDAKKMLFIPSKEELASKKKHNDSLRNDKLVVSQGSHEKLKRKRKKKQKERALWVPGMTMVDVERIVYADAINFYNSIAKAGESLGIPKTTFWRRVRKLDLSILPGQKPLQMFFDENV